MLMTIKQMILGVVVGTSVVALSAHRMTEDKDIPVHRHVLASSKTSTHKTHAHRIVLLPKRHHAGKDANHSEAYLSTRKLYGNNQ